MPIIRFKCECTNEVGKFFRRVSDVPFSFPCNKCAKDMKKVLSAPNSGSKIVIDNGVQARAVEIVPDIVEINKERSSKNYREK